MDELSLSNKVMYSLFYLLSASIIVISIFSYNAYLIIGSSLILLIAALLLHSGHLLNNLIIKRSKIIEIHNGYRLNSNLISASKRVGKSYMSFSVAILRPRPGFAYKNESMKDLIESIKDPFEFSISLNEIDKKRLLDSLETKRRVKEIMLSRLKPNSYDKINNLRRQIEIIDDEISNIANSGKSFDVSIRLKAFSLSESEHESAYLSSKNIELLANKFSSSINVDYEVVKGEALLALT